MHYTKVKAIGIWRESFTSPIEIRFVREGERWVPDLIINHESGLVRSAPECFVPRAEIVTALDRALSEGVTSAAFTPPEVI